MLAPAGRRGKPARADGDELFFLYVTFDGAVVADTLGASGSVTDVRAWNASVVAGPPLPHRHRLRRGHPARRRWPWSGCGGAARDRAQVAPLLRAPRRAEPRRGPGLPGQGRGRDDGGGGRGHDALRGPRDLRLRGDGDGRRRQLPPQHGRRHLRRGDPRGVATGRRGPDGAVRRPRPHRGRGRARRRRSPGSSSARARSTRTRAGCTTSRASPRRRSGRCGAATMLSIGLATDGSNDVRDEDLSPEFIEVAQEGDFYANGTGPVYPSPRVQEMPYNIKYPSIPLADVWRNRTMHSVRIYRGAAGGRPARATIAYCRACAARHDLDVRVKQTAEVQELRTTVGKGRHLGGTFKLHHGRGQVRERVDVDDGRHPLRRDEPGARGRAHRGHAQPPDARQRDGPGLEVAGRERQRRGASSFCSPTRPKGQDLPLLVVDTAKLTGNRAAGVVTELVKGVPEQSISGPSPAFPSRATRPRRGPRPTAGASCAARRASVRFTIVAKDARERHALRRAAADPVRRPRVRRGTTTINSRRQPRERRGRAGDADGRRRTGDLRRRGRVHRVPPPKAQGRRRRRGRDAGGRRGPGHHLERPRRRGSTPTTSTAASSSPSRAGTRTRSRRDSSAEDVAGGHRWVGLGRGRGVAGHLQGHRRAAHVRRRGPAGLPDRQRALRAQRDLRRLRGDIAQARGARAQQRRSGGLGPGRHDQRDRQGLVRRTGRASDGDPCARGRKVNDQLVREVQVVRVDRGPIHSAQGNFTLTFKGRGGQGTSRPARRPAR